VSQNLFVCSILRGRFTLWPKFERPSIFHQSDGDNQEFGLSTPLTTGQSSKAFALQNAYMAVLFDHGDGLLKEVWVRQEWNPNYGRERPKLFSLKKTKTDKILADRLEGLFWADFKWDAPSSFGLWAWSLEASHYAWPKGPIPIYIIDYFQPISLDAQQNLAIQSHGLSTWTTIV
jgi:hypothetical protein